MIPFHTARLCRNCSSRAVQGSSYCAKHQTNPYSAEHKRLYDQNRADDPVRALYRTQRWQATRNTVLRRDVLCVECGHRAATVADHHPMEAREIVERLGEAEFFNPDRCRGCCKQCHDMKTGKDHYAGNNRIRR